MGSGQSSNSNFLTPGIGVADGPVDQYTIVAIKSVSDSKLSDAEHNAIIEGTNNLLPGFCDAWGYPLYKVVNATGYVPGCFGYINTVASDPIPGALGYHTLDVNGNPMSIVNYAAHLQDNSNMNYPGNFSGVDPSSPGSRHSFMSTTFTHEIFEMIADPDLMQQGPNGERVDYTDHTGFTAPIVREVCDPVADQEVTTITLNGKVVYISDYIYPSWFYSNGQAPFDFKGVCTEPLKVYDDNPNDNIHNNYVSDLNTNTTRYEVKDELLENKMGDRSGSSQSMLSNISKDESLEIKINNINNTGSRSSSSSSSISLTSFKSSNKSPITLNMTPTPDSAGLSSSWEDVKNDN